MKPAIDWAARQKRALSHLEKLKAEWKEALRKKRPAQYVKYDYADKED
jgi:hypothetical protein